MVGTRALIFKMDVPYNKTISWVLRFDLVVLNLAFDLLDENSNLGHIF
jgi:hypothetical protein